MQIKIVPKAAYKELADRSIIDRELASRDEQLEEKHFATPQEIEKEKLPTEEILSLPMFKVDEFSILCHLQRHCDYLLVSLNISRF